MTAPLTIHVYGKPVVLTGETLDKTWQWFADNQRECARAAKAGEFFVNDVDSYVEHCEQKAQRYEAHDTESRRLSLTFVQRAHFIQSGQSVPMLT